jgi:hypothetical protein
LRCQSAQDKTCALQEEVDSLKADLALERGQLLPSLLTHVKLAVEQLVDEVAQFGGEWIQNHEADIDEYKEALQKAAQDDVDRQVGPLRVQLATAQAARQEAERKVETLSKQVEDNSRRLEVQGLVLQEERRRREDEQAARAAAEMRAQAAGGQVHVAVGALEHLRAQCDAAINQVNDA